jgi:hypothetical protein
VVKDSGGQEQCFEEGRARARYYRLAWEKFNLLEVAQADDSTMDVSMESVDEGDRKPPARSSSVLLSAPKALFSGDASIDSCYNMNNISTASSTVNERDAVGVATTKEEETINTKLAMRELSMMFSSPAMGLNDTRIEPPVEEEGDTATFSIVAGLVDETAANNSILAAGDYADENDENFARRNPDARETITPGFHQSALRTLAGEDGIDSRVHPVTAGGFQIYEDRQTAQFQIYEEEQSVAVPFQIYEEDQSLAAPFQIYEDGDKRDSGGDTATFSVFGEILKNLDEPRSMPAASAFSMDVDDDSVHDIMVRNDKRSVEMWVRTFLSPSYTRLLVLRQTDDFKKYRPQTATSPEFGDISRIVADVRDLPPFRRAVSPKARQSDVLGVKVSLAYSELHKKDIRKALRKVQVEAREMAFRSAVHPRDSNLTRVLATKGYMDILPKQFVPRALLQNTSAKGSKITLGDRTGFVKEELGRGAYGKVVLMESKDDDVGIVALKAQAPIDCLALEYVILKAVEERVEPHSASHFPYPRALSFVSLADGGLLGMTCGSQSGLNLVDLVNVYKQKERASGVPELVALHYTIRMLKHIEALHWQGKILVSISVQTLSYVRIIFPCALESS